MIKGGRPSDDEKDRESGDRLRLWWALRLGTEVGAIFLERSSVWVLAVDENDRGLWLCDYRRR